MGSLLATLLAAAAVAHPQPRPSMHVIAHVRFGDVVALRSRPFGPGRPMTGQKPAASWCRTNQSPGGDGRSLRSAPRMALYRFVTCWQVDAPIDVVWDAIVQAERWPEWWPGVLAVEEVKRGDEGESATSRATR